MPAHRKSLQELALSGALQARPGRYRHLLEQEPEQIVPVGQAPRHLTADQRKIWSELLRGAPLGIWRHENRLALECVVHLVQRMRQPDATVRDYNTLFGLLGRLGMTPSGRQKLGVELPSKAVEDDPDWAALDVLD